MITFHKFGNYGRLGNQLFQYASLIGLSEKYNHKLVLPDWKYQRFFKGKFPQGKIDAGTINVPEPGFSYDPDYYDRVISKGAQTRLDVHGYFQSEKYWENCTEKVKSALEFTDAYKEAIKHKYSEAFNGKRNISISIRRGDYVGNPNYYQLLITYYITALTKHFPDWKDCNLIIFSDDVDYCKVHFGCLDNVIFTENRFNNLDKTKYWMMNEWAIEQLCLMSMCDDFIIANSTFSWWGAYLGEKPDSKVVCPGKTQHFAGNLATKDASDLYPERWITHTDNKIDAKDVTFMIPVSWDHKDREQNLSLNVCMLQRHFDTNVMVMEQGSQKFMHYYRYGVYKKFDCPHFHRTKMLNDMAKLTDKPIIANWDADVFVPPMQLLQSIQSIRDGAAMVFPYDGRFARVPRAPWFNKFETALDHGVFGINQFHGMDFKNDKMSVGGAILFDKKKYFEGGGENENFVSYGPEDVEREVRFTRLGYDVRRTKGTLYHIDHYKGPNSKSQNQWHKQNHDELDKIYAFNQKGLREYVNTFSWIPK